jgi:hypothetical protein
MTSMAKQSLVAEPAESRLAPEDDQTGRPTSAQGLGAIAPISRRRALAAASAHRRLRAVRLGTRFPSVRSSMTLNALFGPRLLPSSRSYRSDTVSDFSRRRSVPLGRRVINSEGQPLGLGHQRFERLDGGAGGDLVGPLTLGSAARAFEVHRGRPNVQGKRRDAEVQQLDPIT